LYSRQGQIQKAFETAKEEGRAALVIYTTAGFPEPESGLEALVALADAGADVLELGVPFSDPLADGPTIQRSSFQAISHGVDLSWTLECVRQFRKIRGTPVVLFSYLNPILDYGVDRFLNDAVAAGADGLLLTDVPLGCDPELERRFEDSPLDLIRLIAPTTTPARARNIAAHSQGFVYYVSRTGVTGVREAMSETLTAEVTALRAVTNVPVAVGFGISRSDQAAAVAACAEGVIVGSAVVDALGREGAAGASRLVASLRGAVVRGELALS
jgi:tryptophan synthase alpha chain